MVFKKCYMTIHLSLKIITFMQIKLEIGCANGFKLNQYSKILKTKINYGVDLSKKAI